MPLLIVTLILVVFGLIMMFSASYANALYYQDNAYHYIRSQLLYAIVGVVGMFIVSKIDYNIIQKFSWILYFVSLILLIITLFMKPINYARRWIIIGGFTFQPSELAKFATIVLIAALAARYPERMKKYRYGFVQPIILIGAFIAVTVNQTHLSGSIIIIAIACIMMFAGGAKFRWFLPFIIIAVIVAVFLFMYMNLGDDANAEQTENVVVETVEEDSSPGVFDSILYRLEERIGLWLDPFEHDAGYQTVQSLVAIGSGGVFGLGLGNSRQKHLYVPEPQNDFIFSITCEELGFVGAVFVIVLFMIFIFRGFSVAIKAKDKFGALVALGITVQVGIQTIFNIAVVTNAVPNTGISLPFFSQGGTSLVVLLLEVGVLLSISRSSEKNFR